MYQQLKMIYLSKKLFIKTQLHKAIISVAFFKSKFNYEETDYRTKRV